MVFRNKKRRDPFDEIQRCLRKRDYRSALDWFHELLYRNPTSTQIRLRFADTLLLAGSREEALEQYRTVAGELSERGFGMRAVAITKKILELDPIRRDERDDRAAVSVETQSGIPAVGDTLMPDERAG